MKPRSATRYIVVHCSATPDSHETTPEHIYQWHVEDNGWSHEGYHIFIDRQGEAHYLLPLDVRGIHARGYNYCSLAICLAGGVDKDLDPENNFTQEQFETLESVLTGLTYEYPEAEILGHKDLPEVTKECPSFDVIGWWDDKNCINDSLPSLAPSFFGAFFPTRSSW